jgi:pimeloyl-ACP methyl ester carboxylesterase
MPSFLLLAALHLTCIGRGRPVVVIENGLGETAAEWTAVRTQVAKTTRVCTYDRAGYAATPPGPFPRTFDQINLELKVALEAAHERGPFVFAGHSFGGPVVRNFAARYPDLVAGLVLIDAVHEDQKVFYGGAAHSLREGAQGRAIPEPTLDRPSPPGATFQQTEDSQREWSSEYFARWHDHPQTHLLGSKPLVVLARNAKDPDDAARERMLLQLSLASLSDNAIVIFAGYDHDMQKTIPDTVAEAIARAVRSARLR